MTPIRESRELDWEGEHMKTKQTQLPDDVQSIGYKQVRPFDWRQVFRSPSLNFEGTEQDFLNAGYAYTYVQTRKFTRAV